MNIGGFLTFVVVLIAFHISQLLSNTFCLWCWGFKLHLYFDGFMKCLLNSQLHTCSALTQAHAQSQTHTRTHARMHAHTHKVIRMHAHTHMHTHAPTHLYTHLPSHPYVHSSTHPPIHPPKGTHTSVHSPTHSHHLFKTWVWFLVVRILHPFNVIHRNSQLGVPTGQYRVAKCYVRWQETILI